MLDPYTAKTSVLVSLSALIAVIVYLAINLIIGRHERNQERTFYWSTMSLMAVLSCIWLTHIHFNGSQNTVGHFLIPINAIVVAWLLSWKEGLTLFLLGNMGLFAIVALEHFGILPYAPLLSRFHESSHLFLSWQNIVGNMVTYMAIATFFLFSLYFSQRRLDKRNREICSINQKLQQEIRERKGVEEELLRAQKLESLGILAGGIAHDFNNILTTILSNVTIAKMYGHLDSTISEVLTNAETACFRAKSLTGQLLTISKDGALLKKPVSIFHVLRDTQRFMLSGSNAKCEFSIPDDVWVVEVDEGQISQVMYNMVINADQAMPDGGTIKIFAENVVLGQNNPLLLKEGKYVRISVSDQGVGIPERHLPKIFDPFYSTKEKGSGLGLSISLAIIERHNGKIQVESESGIGTTFHIYLPASDKPLGDEGKGVARTGARQAKNSPDR